MKALSPAIEVLRAAIDALRAALEVERASCHPLRATRSSAREASRAPRESVQLRPAAAGSTNDARRPVDAAVPRCAKTLKVVRDTPWPSGTRTQPVRDAVEAPDMTATQRSRTA